MSSRRRPGSSTPGPAIAPNEVRVRVDRLNLDAASYRQIREAYAADPDKIRAAVLDIIATRGKMQNPVTGSGGMLTGTVEEAGPESPLGLVPGQRIATLVSLTLTPLAITDGLSSWDGQIRAGPVRRPRHPVRQVHRRRAATDDLPVPLSLAVLDVCGAPSPDAARGQEGGRGRHHRRRRQERLPLRRRRPPGRRRQGNRSRPYRG